MLVEVRSRLFAALFRYDGSFFMHFCDGSCSLCLQVVKMMRIWLQRLLECVCKVAPVVFL